MQPEQPQTIELVIRQLPNGQIQVSGPINNPILCIGLMEMAKMVITQQINSNVQRGAPGIVPIRGNLPNGI